MSPEYAPASASSPARATAPVERTLIEQADVSRARRAALVDKLAAAYILQGALDFLRARAAPM